MLFDRIGNNRAEALSGARVFGRNKAHPDPDIFFLATQIGRRTKLVQGTIESLHYRRLRKLAHIRVPKIPKDVMLREDCAIPQ